MVQQYADWGVKPECKKTKYLN